MAAPTPASVQYRPTASEPLSRGEVSSPFAQPWGVVAEEAPLEPPRSPHHVDALAALSHLTAPEPPTDEIRYRLKRCVDSGRHTATFNRWLSHADLLSFAESRNLEAGSPLLAFASQLTTLGIPYGRAFTRGTRHLPLGSQGWALLDRLQEILPTGGLLVGPNRGFNKQSSCITIGCSQCLASVYIGCPRMGSSPTEEQQATIQRHLVNFLVVGSVDRAYYLAPPEGVTSAATGG